MNANLRSLLVLATLTFAGAAITPVRDAHAQSAPGGVDDARQHYKRGVELFAESNYSAALVEFRRAYEIAPNFSVLYNIAQIHYQLRDYAEALRTFQSYMTEGGAKVPAARRAEVEKDMGFLRDRVGYVELVSDSPGAEVTVDGVTAGKVPLKEPIIVSAGRRRVELLRADRVLSTKLLEVAAGDHIKLELNGASASPPAVTTTPAVAAQSPTPSSPSVSPSSDVPEPPTDRGAGPAVAWTLTGGLAVGTAVVGFLALGASSDLSTKRTTDGTTRDTLDKAQSKVKTLALVTDLLGAGTIVGAGIAAYLTFGSRSNGNASPSTATTVGVRIGANSVAVAGSF